MNLSFLVLHDIWPNSSFSSTSTPEVHSGRVESSPSQTNSASQTFNTTLTTWLVCILTCPKKPKVTTQPRDTGPTGCAKKMGISEWCSVCSSAQLMLNLEPSFLIHVNSRSLCLCQVQNYFWVVSESQDIDFSKIQFDINYLQVPSPLP